MSLPLMFPAMRHLAADLAVDEDKVTPGLLGFAVVALLALVTWFLMRSLNNQLKKVDFEEPEPEPEPGTEPGTGRNTRSARQ